jgi:hypothetical protein
MDPLKSGAIFRLRKLDHLRSPPIGVRAHLTSDQKNSNKNKKNSSIKSNILSQFDAVYRATPLPMAVLQNDMVNSSLGVNSSNSKMVSPIASMDELEMTSPILAGRNAAEKLARKLKKKKAIDQHQQIDPMLPITSRASVPSGPYEVPVVPIISSKNETGLRLNGQSKRSRKKTNDLVSRNSSDIEDYDFSYNNGDNNNEKYIKSLSKGVMNESNSNSSTPSRATQQRPSILTMVSELASSNLSNSRNKNDNSNQNTLMSIGHQNESSFKLPLRRKKEKSKIQNTVKKSSKTSKKKRQLSLSHKKRRQDKEVLCAQTKITNEVSSDKSQSQEVENNRRSSRNAARIDPNLWSDEQLDLLNRIVSSTSTKRSNFWNLVANQIPGKNSEACKNRYDKRI